MRWAPILLLAGCVVEPTSEVAQALTPCDDICADTLTIPSDHPAVDWVANASTYSYAPADDHTMRFGWNADNADPTEPRLYLLFESNYQPTVNHPALMEWPRSRLLAGQHDSQAHHADGRPR